jgi:glycosyltransferase involved in cell wall biosynthesis
MFFSIIIPTYNRAAILKDTLLSVLEQSFDDYEILVVDDGSTDDTKEVVAELNNNKIFYHHKLNEERSIARNFGAAKANGNYLIFLDSDDRMLNHYLFSLYKFIKTQTTEPTFIFTGYRILNPDKTTLYEYGCEGLFDPTKLFFGNFLGCSSVVISRNLFTKFYFDTDPRLILFEDWELWLRVIADNKLICFPSKSIIMINHDSRSVLNYDVDQIKNRIQHFKNHVLKNLVSINRRTSYKRLFLAGIYSYASLHIAMTKKSRSDALNFLFMAFIEMPGIIFKRRFFGILKNLI